MNLGSIRLRLLIAAAIAVIAALAIAGAGLIYLFERHVERRVARDLTGYLNQLIVATNVAPDGSLSMVNGPADPRFSAPLSGLYWQVELGRRDQPAVALAVGFDAQVRQRFSA